MPDHEVEDSRGPGGPVTVRAATPSDLPFLWDMLFEAAAVSPTMCALGQEAALAQDENQKYLAGWGRAGDTAVIAVAARGQRLGAAWYRLFPAEAPAYGFVAATVPEVTIGVQATARGQGLGTRLLEALGALARDQGCRQLSPSVDRENPARRLYERLGFVDPGVALPEDSSITLVATL
jgi:GNAT superfamily N-acetyltransferase